ncbi:uncharacterized protein Fot_07796 [Forsythia ovata]|uniref:DUF7138 domain-containing protein n=1 Tax=Forsythia ovata TaxID=205694 RepID=A0ABD1WX97_9LAMI
MAAQVSVLFFKGEKETNFGNILIYPKLDYKLFQIRVGQMIGKFPNQISIYLVKKPYSPAPKAPEMIPVNENIDFRVLCSEKDIIFLVFLDRSEISRNPPERTHGFEVNDFLLKNEVCTSPQPVLAAENLVHTRLNVAAQPYHTSTLPDLNARLQDLKVQRENFQSAMARQILNPNLESGHYENLDSVWNMDSSRMKVKKDENEKRFCKDCEDEKKKGETSSFHPCVNDAVVIGFRTQVGSIAPPKNDPVSVTTGFRQIIQLIKMLHRSLFQ